MLCKTLRFIAHTNGASLQFVSNKEEALISKVFTLKLIQGSSHTFNIRFQDGWN